jgi:hypothetical protein
MCGVILVVQVVHYPSFSFVEPERFSIFHAEHVQRITLIVAPLMTIEIACSASLLGCRGMDRVLAIAGFVLLVVVWGTTFLVAVPAHEALSKGFSETAHSKLVATNWVRTLAWTARMVPALGLVLSRRKGWLRSPRPGQTAENRPGADGR